MEISPFFPYAYIYVYLRSAMQYKARSFLFFFFLSFSYMLSFSAPVFHYYVLSVSRIQTNVYVWVPISIKTFPRRAAPPRARCRSSAVVCCRRRHPVNPSHPWLLFSRRTYFINARPSPRRPAAPSPVAPLDGR